MTLLIVFLPLVNYLLFVLFARYVNRFTLAIYTISSMGGLLAVLLSLYPTIVEGSVTTSTLGT